MTRSVWGRFWEKVDATGDCWVWTGAKSFGYGRISVGTRESNKAAHRWAWETLVGPIPPGLQLDHLCRNRACVNPDHLEPVSSHVNHQRAPRQVYGAHLRRRTHCPKGHPYSGDNLAIQESGHRSRLCRTCRRDSTRARRAFLAATITGFGGRPL